MGSQKGAQIEYLPISRFYVGEAMRRRFWRDLKFQLRHSSIIQLPNKPLGDPIGTFGLERKPSDSWSLFILNRRVSFLTQNDFSFKKLDFLIAYETDKSDW